MSEGRRARDATIAFVASLALDAALTRLPSLPLTVGGQSVFEALHDLFMTAYGCYICVFNMEDLVDQKSPECAIALAALDRWLNSIAIYTLASPTPPPVVFVGTVG